MTNNPNGRVTLFRARRVLAPDGWIADGWIAAQDGLVREVGCGATTYSASSIHDLAHMTIVPGYCDLQVNGGGGFMFSLDRSAQAYRSILRAHASTGTTAICPTIISGPAADMTEAVRLVVEVAREHIPDGARVAGIHIEGPFLSPDRRGGHAQEHLMMPSVELLDSLIAAGDGLVKIVTLAPELPGADEIIQMLASRGILVSAGHSKASAEVMHRAVRLGLSGVTHVFNGMAPLQSRDPGIAGVALASDLQVGIIGDLLHLAPDTVLAVVRAKNPGHLYLTTDAVSPLGADAPSFDLYGVRVRVRDGGCYTDDGVLAGTATPLAKMVRNLVTLGLAEDQAINMATGAPAATIGRAREFGSLRVGALADMTVLDDDLSVAAVIIGGNLISS